MKPLPINECLDELCRELGQNNAAVLVAPPGAGKTTRVPLALLDQSWAKGKRIIVLEPRRIAARSAAQYMAGLIGEKAGQTVGYRVRMDTRIGPDTRIEVVTEGVFNRMILKDPELSSIAAVLFDECHERNLDGDLALALALDVQSAFRPDLRLVPMSATLDGAKIASLFDNARVIESHGRSFDVAIAYQSMQTGQRLEDAMASAVRKALAAHDGSILCFLPGQAEILRTAERLTELPGGVELCPLYGAVDQARQDRAIAPIKPPGRKVVLASAIAQTSITIEGVEVVIDSGLARVPVYEPDTGVTRLQTVRASKASITQRAGRAGRTAPGTAIRLWHEGSTSALPEYEKPAILTSDLTSLALDLAKWGVSDPAALRWQDKPPAPAFAEAQKLLQLLGAVDNEGRLTPNGERMAEMPLQPRLAHMITVAANFAQADKAALLAMLVSEPGAGGQGIDLARRLARIASEKGQRAEKILKSARSLAAAVSSSEEQESNLSPGAILSMAWPDRIAKQVGNDGDGYALYHLANGRRARLDGLDQLAKQQWLVIADLQGSAASARILSAAALELDEIRLLHGEQIIGKRIIEFDEKTSRYKARKVEHLGALELRSGAVALEAGDDVPQMILERLRSHGLPASFFGEAATNQRRRMAFLHSHFPDRFPAMDDQDLLNNLEDWLLPFLDGATGIGDIGPDRILSGLQHRFGFENIGELDRLAPARLETPAGSSHKLQYEDKTVTLSARVQEFYGMTAHPHVMEGRVPVKLEFLSPAGRPIQTTMDILSFWNGSWHDVRKDMRGRYPKHPWPENPDQAIPTTRAKPRK